MIVFKLYWKIFRKNIVTVFIYFTIFILIAMITMQSYQGDVFSFRIVKTEMAFVDEDNTELSRGLKSYLEKYAIFKDIDAERVEDALFYHDISLFVIVPSGFTESLKEGEILAIKIKSDPKAPGTQLITQVINKYAHLAYVYINNDLETENLVSTLQQKLDQEAIVDEYEVEKRDYSHTQYYYNYMAYLLLALIITVISSIMLSFKPLEIKRRNLLGAISNRKLNLILFFCNFLLGIGFLAALILLSIVLYPNQILTRNGLLMMVNAFIFTLPTIALSYLIVTLFDTRTVISAFGTVFSLGFSFITGVFIPQFLLDKNILMLARIIPSYYYVLNNNEISTVNNFTNQNLKPIFNNFLIQIAFAVIFVAASVYVARRRETQES